MAAPLRVPSGPRPRPRPWPPLLGTLLAAACAAPRLPPGFAEAAEAAPSEVPVRVWIEGDRLVGAAVPVGPGGLPAAVRHAVDAIAPGGEQLFAGREWGPWGEGFRIEKRYVEPGQESFRSLLLTADGQVLERSHSVPLAQIPNEILLAAMSIGRDLLRCEIVSGPAAEQFWRATLRDRIGRDRMAIVSLDGRIESTARVLPARIVAQ